MRSPVLFLVFNRPETTRQVFEVIRAAQPPRLYIAADGPKEDREGEAERCEKVRTIVTSLVDWSCKVYTLFRNKNLGCRFAPQSAIDWFFTNEKEGVILEDDCLPHPDFFSYCDWALRIYAEDKNIWHINGNNFDCKEGLFGARLISFSALAQVWGWATWRDRWQAYQGNPFYLMSQSQLKVSNWMLSPMAKINKMEHIDCLQRGLDAWDYQWQATILNHQGLCVSCRSNLISNLGDGVDATHTQQDDRVRLKTRAIQTPLEYLRPSFNNQLTNWYEKKMGLRKIKVAMLLILKSLFRTFKVNVRSFLAKILFRGVKPIVVSSTGRNGSTLLFNAIAESLVLDRFKFDPKSVFGKFVVKLSQAYVDSISDVNLYSFPVIKTHSLFHPECADKARYIFVYGDPLESAQSVELMVKKHGAIWLDAHIYHLSSNGHLDDLYERDILNFENQINSWMFNSGEAVFAIKFDELWEKKNKLSDHLGFEIILPPRKNRTPKPIIECYNIDLFNRLKKNMGKYAKIGKY